MKLITGLGNPGDKYKFTRHNAGFMALDYLSYKLDFSFKLESKFKGEIAKINFCGEPVMFLKPQTFMNLSGDSLIAVMNFYKIPKEDLLVIYDDIALPTGKMRFRTKGSDGGHNGIKSIIKVLGGDNTFDRLKIGIGPQPPIPSETYVLQNFTDDQLSELKPTLQTIEEAVSIWVKEGITTAQDRFN
jgi:PTH1 family peptidyl-tRNA hydrolase